MGDIDNAKFDFVLNLVFMKNLSLIFFKRKKQKEKEEEQKGRRSKGKTENQGRSIKESQHLISDLVCRGSNP